MLVSRSIAPLFGEDVEDVPVDVPVEPAPPDGFEPEDSDVGDDAEVLLVLVPLGTVLLPPAPELPLPDEAPPVGEAAPPPMTEDTRVVPLTAAGTP